MPPLTPLLFVHICAATVGLLSGFLSMAFRKGSSLHRLSGNVFVISMLTMSSSAVYIAAFLRPIMINVIAGLLTFYLVSTGWWAGKRRDGAAGIFDVASLLFALAVGTAGWAFGFRAINGSTDLVRIPPPIYFIFGSVAFLCAITDIRLLRNGGVAGAQRVARHLWRMCLALLIATLSFYPGQAKLMPQWLRDSRVLFVPHILLVGSMIYWMVRVRLRKRVPQNKPVVARYAAAIVDRTVDTGRAA